MAPTALTGLQNDCPITFFNQKAFYPVPIMTIVQKNCPISNNLIIFSPFFTVPEIEVVDDRDKKTAEKYYKGGSTIELKCIVRQIVGEPPEYILWHHESRMLNYDTERGGVR